MKSIALAGMVLAMLVPALADAAEPPLHAFSMRAHSQHFDPTKTITSTRFMFHTRADWRRLALIDYTVPYVAELDGDVPAAVQAQVGIGGKTPLTTGTVLFGAAAVNGETLYCTRVRSILLDMVGAACLIDTDTDGFFDTAIKGSSNTWVPETVAISGTDMVNSTKNALISLHLSQRVALPTPIAYHARDLSLAPRIQGDIAWASDYSSETRETRPIQFMFVYRMWAQGSGGAMISNVHHVVYTGKPITVDLNGISLAIQGIGPNGELICTLDGELHDQAMVMAHYLNPIPIW